MDTSNHPFYENLFNGKTMPDMITFFQINFLNEHTSGLTNQVEGKYDKQ